MKNGNLVDFVFSLYFFNMPSSVFKTRHKFGPAPIRIIEEETLESLAYRLAEAHDTLSDLIRSANVSARDVLEVLLVA